MSHFCSSAVLWLRENESHGRIKRIGDVLLLLVKSVVELSPRVQEVPEVLGFLRPGLAGLHPLQGGAQVREGHERRKRKRARQSLSRKRKRRRAASCLGSGGGRSRGPRSPGAAAAAAGGCGGAARARRGGAFARGKDGNGSVRGLGAAAGGAGGPARCSLLGSGGAAVTAPGLGSFTRCRR
ncbi:hypothetical protein LUU34_00296100 [Aix galericulata]|nr:hypothetical protein LUU34_00296100 [Aix galericulata]